MKPEYIGIVIDKTLKKNQRIIWSSCDNSLFNKFEEKI